jgi:nucleotide-binding universal stress UspA family protein
MKGFRRILIPHDFSEHATRALRAAARLAEPGARLLVLHVVTPIVPLTDVPPAGLSTYIAPDELVDGAKRQLTRLVAKVGGTLRDVKADAKVVIGDPYTEILEAAKRVDLIVMSTRGRSGLAHLLIGSVTEKVVRHSPVPVLTLRPEAAGKAARRAS